MIKFFKQVVDENADRVDRGEPPSTFREALAIWNDVIKMTADPVGGRKESEVPSEMFRDFASTLFPMMNQHFPNQSAMAQMPMSSFQQMPMGPIQKTLMPPVTRGQPQQLHQHQQPYQQGVRVGGTKRDRSSKWCRDFNTQNGCKNR